MNFGISDAPVLASFTIDRAPVGKARARRGPGGNFYTPNATAEYQQAVGWLARAAMTHPRNDTDLLGVVAEFHTSAVSGDVDNFLKALLDGCNQIVWADDIQVVEVGARLHRKSDRPRTEVTIYIVESKARTCEACGNGMTAVQVRANRRYCSKRCYDTDQRKSTYRACSGCGQPVYRSPSVLGGLVFCTQECRRSRRARCRVCGEEVNDKPTSRKRFCGTECSQKWHRERRSADPSALANQCDTCGAPCSRSAKSCRTCFLARMSQGSSHIQRRIEAGLKRCSKCDQTKPFEDFSMDRSSPDGRQLHCKPCHATYQARRGAA